MKTAVQKWGNSLAIRIPRSFALETQLGNGTEVELQMKSGSLVISRARRNSYRLSDLLSQVRRTNVHSETEWGAPTRRECW